MSGARTSTGRLFQIVQGPRAAKLRSLLRPRSRNDQLSRLCRMQVTTASARWRRLTVRLQASRSHTVLTLVYQNCCLECDPLSNWQPVKFTQDRSHTLAFYSSCNETSGSALVRWGEKWNHLSMTRRLTTDYAKNYCYRTVIVKDIVTRKLCYRKDDRAMRAI